MRKNDKNLRDSDWSEEDELLAAALRESVRRESEEILAECGRLSAEEPFEGREELWERIKEGMRCESENRRREERRRAALRRALNISKWAAAVALVVLTTFAVGIVNANTQREDTYKFSAAGYKIKNPIVLTPGEIIAEPTWIPEGYELTESDESGCKVYENGSGGQIEYDYVNKSVSFTLTDGELEYCESVTVNGCEGTVMKYENEICIIWVDRCMGLIHIIKAWNEELDTAMKVAESVART